MYYTADVFKQVLWLTSRSVLDLEIAVLPRIRLHRVVVQYVEFQLLRV